MTRNSHNWTSNAAVIFAVAAVAVLAFAIQLRRGSNARSAAEARAQSWKDADDSFRQTQYRRAIPLYDKILEGAAPTGEASETTEGFEADLVKAMQSLCERVDRVETSQPQGAAPTTAALDELAIERPRFSELQAVWEKRPPPDDAAKQSSGTAFSPTQRWSEMLSGLEAQVARRLDAASASGGSSLASLDADAEILRFLEREGRPTSVLSTKWQEVRSQSDYRERVTSAIQRSKQAEASLAMNDILDARNAWDSLSRDHPARFQARPRDEFLERVRAKLLVRLQQAVAAPQNGSTLTASAGPSRLRWSDHSAFTSQNLSAAGQNDKTRELAFVRSDDLCFALEAATGTHRWVCRVGFDAPGLPQVTSDSPQRIALGWNDGDADALGISSADDLSSVWARRLPAGTRLAGPPVLFGRSLCVLSSAGTLWQLDSSSGTEIGAIEFHEPPAAPLSVRSDGRGLVVAGKDLGIYLLEGDDRLSLRTLAIRTSSDGVLTSHCLWMAPFVLLIENLRSDACRIRVYRDGPKGLTEVQSRLLPGRLWQAPALHGAQLLCLTDTGSEIVLGINSEAGNSPLYEIMSRTATLPREAVLQQIWTASHSDAPFLAATGSTVRRLEIQQAAADGGARRIHWEHGLASRGSVPIQPLQTTSRSVVCGFGQEEGGGTGVVSLHIKSGRPEWSIELRGVAAEWRVPPDDATLDYVLARTSDNRWFRVSRTKDESICRSLPGLSGDGLSEWLPGGYSILSAEGDPLKLRRVSLEGTEQFSVPLRAPLASPLAGRADGIECLPSDGGAPKAVAGTWAAWIDTARRLHIASTDRKAGGFVRYLQLPLDLPAEGWLRPIWMGPSRLLLAHPRGHVVRAILKSDADLMFAEMTHSERVAEDVLASPLVLKEALWIATSSGQCLVLNPETLKSNVSVKLPAKAVTPLVPVRWKSFHGVATGLENGCVAFLPADDPEQVTISPATGARLRRLIADADQERLIATDGRGRVLELDAKGEVVRDESLPAADSAPPLIRGGVVHVPLVNGGLHEVWGNDGKTADLPIVPGNDKSTLPEKPSQQSVLSERVP
jgi:hypothetical protein